MKLWWDTEPTMVFPITQVPNLSPAFSYMAEVDQLLDTAQAQNRPNNHHFSGDIRSPNGNIQVSQYVHIGRNKLQKHPALG